MVAQMMIGVLGWILGTTPVEFSCRNLRYTQSPRTVICQSKVVLRYRETLMCCDRFEGYTDAEGTFNRLVCNGHVRAQRDAELLWSEQADYLLDVEDVVFVGNPELLRGKSRLWGDRILLEPERDQAHVENPRGKLALQETPEPIALPELLPKKCPLPSRPSS